MKVIGLHYDIHQEKCILLVQDQVNGQTIPEKSFTIRVMPVNNMPPKIMNPKPVVTVTQGGTVPIGSNVIYISDSDTVMDDLVVLLAEAPQAGTLVKKVQGMRVELRSGEPFWYLNFELLFLQNP